MTVEALDEPRLGQLPAAVSLGHDHLNDLPTTGDEFAERAGLRVGDGARGRAHLLGEAGDDLGIERIGLGQPSGGAREVADLPRVDNGQGQAGGGDRGGDRYLEPAGGFQHDELQRHAAEPLGESCQAFAIARHGKSFSRRAQVHIEAILRDIDADKVLLHLHPSLPMRARSAAQATVRVRWNDGWGTRLCDGLLRPRHDRAPIRHRTSQLTPRRQPRHTRHRVHRGSTSSSRRRPGPTRPRHERLVGGSRPLPTAVRDLVG